MTLETRPVDPRDVTIEESEATYRVYFWSNDGSRCREFEAVGADQIIRLKGDPPPGQSVGERFG